MTLSRLLTPEEIDLLEFERLWNASGYPGRGRSKTIAIRRRFGLSHVVYLRRLLGIAELEAAVAWDPATTLRIRRLRDVGRTRAMLRASGLPWVIENVREAKLHDPIVLCGSAFGLRVRRHRYFESNFLPFELAPSCHHNGLLPFMHKGERAYTDAMGCEWMNVHEAREAIPPAYTEFIGRALFEHLALTHGEALIRGDVAE